MIRRILPYIVCLLLCPAAPAGAVDVDSLFTEAVGGEDALAAIRGASSYQAFGKADLSGLTGAYRITVLMPNRIRIDVDLGQIELIQAFDGKVAWQQDHNGRVSRLEGFERRQLLQSLYLESYSFVVDGRIPGSEEFLGDTVVNGGGYYMVGLYPLDRDTVTMLLDKETAFPRYLISRLDNLQGITTLSGAYEVSGVRIAERSRTEFVGAPVFTEFTIDSAAFDVDLDPSLFAMPGSRVSDYRFSGGTESVTIPFEYHRGHIWIPATVNGKVRAWFILDSGASANLLHGETFDGLALQEAGRMPVMGLGGMDEIRLVQTDSLQIGSLTLLDQLSGIMDIKALGLRPADDKPVGGILGHDFLSRFPVLIDYENAALTVFNPDGFTPPPGGREVDFHLTLLVPTVSAEVAGVRGDFIFDLGNAVGLVLHERFFRSKRLDTLLVTESDARGSMSGVGGSTELISAVVPEFRIGPVTLTDIRCHIPASTQGFAGSEELAGNIGNDVLRDFRVLLDYGRSKLILYDQ